MSREDRRGCLERLMQRSGPLSASELAELQEAFPEVLTQHRPGVWAVLRRRGLQRAEMEDLVQVIFISLHGLIAAGSSPKPLAAWLYRSARSKAWTLRRAKQREPFSTGLPSSGSEPPLTPGLDRAMDRHTVPERVLSQLSDEDRAIIEAVEVDELSYEEAAEALDIPLGTFKRRLPEARERLAVLALQYQGPGGRAA
jgi:RNA polymerase sigma-70 factor, ECF subfamily